MFIGPNDLWQVPNLFSSRPFMTYDWTIGRNSTVHPTIKKTVVPTLIFPPWRPFSKQERLPDRVSFSAPFRSPTIKKTVVPMLIFLPWCPFSKQERLPLGVSFSAHFCSWFSWPPPPFSSSQHDRRTCHSAIFLSLFGCTPSVYTKWDIWRASLLSSAHYYITMSFVSPNNLRRSSRIGDTSYRPRTTWSLPEIVSVVCIYFFKKLQHSHEFLETSVWPSSRENAGRHVPKAEEDHMDVDNAVPTGGGMFRKLLPSNPHYLCSPFSLQDNNLL